MYFHTDSGSARELIRTLALRAEKDKRSLRIDVDSQGNLRMKVGEGMWSAPIASTPDPYRDASGCNRNCAVVSEADRHYLDCPVWGFQSTKVN